MKLGITAWSFPACTLIEVAGIAGVLGLESIDVGLFYASSLDKQRILAQPGEAASELADLGLPISNFYYLFGGGAGGRNLAQPRHLDANVADFRQVVRFCRAAKIESVMLLPGVINPHQSRHEALEESARSLSALLPVAQEAGVRLVIEPHVHSYLESPALTLELLERVPGLQLALDYAHFTCLGYRQGEIDVLAPHAGHVHLRQARMGVLQNKLEEGTINFAALLGRLREVGYAHTLALEYVHQDYMGTRYDDVLTETVKLRDLVRTYL